MTGYLVNAVKGLDYMIGKFTEKEIPARTGLLSIEVDGHQHERVPPGETECKVDTSIHNLSSMWNDTTRKYKECIASGKRDLIKSETQKDGLPICHFGSSMYYTYEEVGMMVEAFGDALLSVGVTPQPKMNHFDDTNGKFAVLIYEDTCIEWFIAAMGCWCKNIIVVTSYATLGFDAAMKIAEEVEINTIVCNRATASRIAEYNGCIRNIIYTDNNIAEVDRELPLPPSLGSSGTKVFSFVDLLKDFIKPKISPHLVAMTLSHKKLEKKLNANVLPRCPPKVALGKHAYTDGENSIALIMYSSGTTGKPKGVVLLHRNVICGVRMILTEAHSALTGHVLRHVAFLPMAHIFELTVQLAAYFGGGFVGYADPRSVTDNYARPRGAFKEYKPTIVVGVPRLFDTIRRVVSMELEKATGFKKTIIDAAFESRKFAQSKGKKCPLFNALVFSKIRAIFGGRVVLCVSGGGPITAETQHWLRLVLSCEVLQGYGMTETSGILSCQVLGAPDCDSVGPPVTCLNIKLVSGQGDGKNVLDRHGRPYLTTDRVSAHTGHPIFGRGEIVAKGPNIMAGYFKSPELTKSALVDGWLSTGDIAEWRQNGTLSIIGRAKHLVKLSGGEYISLESLESVYCKCPFIDVNAGGIVIYADGTISRPIGVLQVSTASALKWAQENSISSDSLDNIVHLEKFNQDVLASLRSIAEDAGLAPLEKVAVVVVLHDPWTPANGCLTPTNKLCRRVIEARHAMPIKDAIEKCRLR